MYVELLGFDIRMTLEEYSYYVWTQQNREEMLINSDTEWPMTIDSGLWPSFFKYYELPSELKKFETLYDKQTMLVEPKEFRHDYSEFWQNYEGMINFFKKLSDRAGVAIAVTMLSEVPFELREGLSWLLPLKGANIPAGWIFLGYDVAELSSQISFLCNSLIDEELPELRENWGPLLNEHGLFSDERDALNYRATLEDPNHGPFDVFGIYRHPNLINAE